MLQFRRKLEKQELEILDLFTISFSIFKINFKNFLLIALLCAMPIIILSIYFPPSIFNPEEIQTISQVIEWLKQQIGKGFYINSIASWFFNTISTLAISILVEAIVYNRIRSASWAISKSFRVLIPVIITSIIYSIFVFIGLVAFIIPGIILIVFFMFVNNICMLRHTWGINALRYSTSLVRKKFFKSFFIIMFIFLFENMFIISFPSAPIDTRDGVLYYALSMILLHIFDTYFKIIISLYFLNIDFINNNKQNGIIV